MNNYSEMLEQIFVVAISRLKDQMDSCDAVDQKIGTCIGFAGVIVAIATGIKTETLITAQLVFHTLGYIIIAISLVTLFVGYRAINLRTGLEIKEIVDVFRKQHDKKILLYTQIEYLDVALKENTEMLREKNQYLAKGALLLIIGVIGYIISYLIGVIW